MSISLAITAAVALSPYGLTTDDFARGFTTGATVFQEGTDLGHYFKDNPHIRAALVPKYDAKKLLNTRSINSLDRLTRHTCVAMESLHGALGFSNIETRRTHFEDDRLSIILGSSGPVQSTLEFDLQTVRNPQYLQPSLFPNSVTAIPASYCAIRHSVKGSCLTLTNDDVSVVDAFAIAAKQIQNDRIDMVLLGGAVEVTPAYATCVKGSTLLQNRAMPPLTEGAYLFAVQSSGRECPPGSKTLALVLGATSLFCPQIEQGLSVCLNRLGASTGRDLASARWLVSDSAFLEGDPRLAGKQVIRLNERLGYLGAMYAGAAVMAALCDPRVGVGEEVLVICTTPEGACGCLLLEKRGSLAPDPLSGSADPKGSNS